jgi:ribonuclease HI
MVTIYTDGSNSLKTGLCSWAVVVIYRGDVIRQRCGFEKGANGKAELRAVVEALKMIPANGQAIIYSDAEYAIGALTHWRAKWEANGYKTAKGYPIAHLELVQEGHRLLDCRKVLIEHVKGHSGIRGNELADKLARAARAAGEGKESDMDLTEILMKTPD